MSLFAPFDPGTLSGKAALVTGAGGGIGAAVARRLAGAGVRLVLADRDTAALEQTARSLGGAETLAWAGDLGKEPELRALFERVLGELGRLDIAVNAAGWLRPTRFEEIDKAEWDAVMDANVGS